MKSKLLGAKDQAELVAQAASCSLSYDKNGVYQALLRLGFKSAFDFIVLMNQRELTL